MEQPIQQHPPSLQRTLRCQAASLLICDTRDRTVLAELIVGGDHMAVGLVEAWRLCVLRVRDQGRHGGHDDSQLRGQVLHSELQVASRQQPMSTQPVHFQGGSCKPPDAEFLGFHIRCIGIAGHCDGCRKCREGQYVHCYLSRHGYGLSTSVTQRTVSSITTSDVEGCMCVWECVCLSEPISESHTVGAHSHQARKRTGAQAHHGRVRCTIHGKPHPPPLGTD